jgi:uncharacterized protein YecT (DUF1311 family)
VLNLALIGLVVAFPSLAQTTPPVTLPKAPLPSSEPEPCEPGANLPGVQCMARLQKGQDRKLNEAYRAALRVMPESDTGDSHRNREHLAKAQRAWLLYRREHCIVVGWEEGGSNMSATFASQQCEWALTEERIFFLNSLVENHER